MSQREGEMTPRTVGMQGATGPQDLQDEALLTFQGERRRLFGVAYRMLGSIGEAEDVLQEAYLRWQRVGEAGREQVERPAAYLVRLVTRLCIDVLRSAHARRMEYVGPWLPEPLVDGAVDQLTHDPTSLHELADDLSLAFLVLLERLSPVERAVLLLRESFDFSYRDIAPIVGKTQENCRQIERRAKRRLSEAGGSPKPVDQATHERLLKRFLEATRQGDVDGLLAILAEDVVSYADGGGKVTTARRPVVGAAQVARYLVGLGRHAPAGVDYRLGRVNGAPGLLTYIDGRLGNVVSIYVEGGRIRRIFIVVNPEKLLQPST
jgi:RNA polymerase sigma-70 factor (ECF subfamily)